MPTTWPGHSGDARIKLSHGFAITSAKALSPVIYNCRTREQIRIIPIVLRPCTWQNEPIARFSVLPSSGNAITGWPDRDEAFLAVVSGLRDVLDPQSLATGGHYQGKHEQSDRERLLKHVDELWIKGLLERSLYNAALIELDMREQPDIVTNPWRFVVQETDLPARPLPANTPIIDVFDKAQEALLILGEPGAGKTTLLLELTRSLLERARHNERLPIPIFFNLSSWTQQHTSFSEWL